MEAQTEGSPRQKSNKGKQPLLRMTNEPTQIPQRERFNPLAAEVFEPSGSHLSC